MEPTNDPAAQAAAQAAQAAAGDQAVKELDQVMPPEEKKAEVVGPIPSPSADPSKPAALNDPDRCESWCAEGKAVIVAAVCEAMGADATSPAAQGLAAMKPMSKGIVRAQSAYLTPIIDKLEKGSPWILLVVAVVEGVSVVFGALKLAKEEARLAKEREEREAAAKKAASSEKKA